MRHTIGEELQAVTRWATLNNLRLNSDKTKEMIVLRRARGPLPEPVDGLTRVSTLNILGITLRPDLRVTAHVDEILAASSGSLHALRILRSHGLPPMALQEVTRATTVARIMYAAPAWWGFTSADDRARVERFLRRLRRTGYLKDDFPTAEDMAKLADERLLAAVIRCDHHVLRGLFPPVINTKYHLRPRPHNYSLPPKDNRQFIPRVLYRSSL